MSVLRHEVESGPCPEHDDCTREVSTGENEQGEFRIESHLHHDHVQDLEVEQEQQAVVNLPPAPVEVHHHHTAETTISRLPHSAAFAAGTLGALVYAAAAHFIH